jgi:hypothetical protein
VAAITKSGTVSLCSDTPPQLCMLSGLVAGEAIAIGDICYVKASDGAVYKTNGTSANAAALYDGVYLGSAAVAAGEAITLYRGVHARYGAALTVAARAYAATTAGLLVDAATTGGTVPVGMVVDATRVYFFFPNR